MRYLNQGGQHDPALIQELQIGYAPGRSLRRHLTTRGYSFDLLRQFSLLNSQGSDAFYPRIVFPLRQDEPIVNLYGRSLGTAFAHRFLSGSKGGLYAWEEGTAMLRGDSGRGRGRFDYAVLWQAGSAVTWGAIKGAPEWAEPLGGDNQLSDISPSEQFWGGLPGVQFLERVGRPFFSFSHRPKSRRV